MNEWDGHTLASMLDVVAERHGDAEALVFGSLRLTYEELRDQVDRVAGGLLHLEIDPGDRVAIWMPNSPEWIIAELATARIGAVFVPINTRLGTDDLLYLLHHTDARALFLRDRFLSVDCLAAIADIAPGVLAGQTDPHLPYLQHLVVAGGAAPPGTISFEDLGRRGQGQPVGARAAAAQPDDLVAILYTSGTTARPRGAMLTHASVLPHSYALGASLDYHPADRILLALPLAGTWGCIGNVLSALTHGACLVLMEWFEAGEALRWLDRERCTVMHGMDSMFTALLRHPDRARYDLSYLQRGVAAMLAGGGTPTMRAIVEELGVGSIVQAYGMTEANIGIFRGRPRDPLEVRLKVGGYPAPGMAVRIVDPDAGRDLPPGEIGEIWIKGSNVCKGYYKDPEETARRFDPDGWFHTSDLGMIDLDGHYVLTGRRTEMFKSNGFNVSPREIEEFLLLYPGVEQAFVVGVPEPQAGEVPFAFVIPAPGQTLSEAEIIDHCRGRIATFKVPRHVRVVDDVPRGLGPHGGKAQKHLLRQLALKDLGLPG